MTGGATEAWCYIVGSSLGRSVLQNYVCDVAAPCDFEQPVWKVRLRDSVPCRGKENTLVQNTACRWGAG